MADYNNRTELNVSGKYYVDLHCICCGICTLTAPMNIYVNTDEEYGYIGKQPENETEVKAVEKAMRDCPVEAIGADGDEIDNTL